MNVMTMFDVILSLSNISTNSTLGDITIILPDHTINYDDIALCEQVGFYKTDETEQENPTMGKRAEKANLWYDTKADVAFIKYEFLPDVPGSVNIYNVMGQPVANRNLEPNSRLAMLHLSNTVSGDYFYIIRSANGMSVSGKFIVIK